MVLRIIVIMLLSHNCIRLWDVEMCELRRTIECDKFFPGHKFRQAKYIPID